jgi:CCR4-NOT transcription complex subunit 7/8
MSSGLVYNPDMSWVTFCSAYDFAYLVKVLMGRKLPRPVGALGVSTVRQTVRVYFGTAVYDIKHMARVAYDTYGKVALLGGLVLVVGPGLGERGMGLRRPGRTSERRAQPGQR